MFRMYRCTDIKIVKCCKLLKVSYQYEKSIRTRNNEAIEMFGHCKIVTIDTAMIKIPQTVDLCQISSKLRRYVSCNSVKHTGAPLLQA